MSQTKKKRIRTAILVSAVSATACAGQVIGDPPATEGSPETEGTGGDHSYLGDPVGDCCPGPQNTGGHVLVGTGGFAETGGTGGQSVGTGGAPIGDVHIGVPPEFGGMGGAFGGESD